MSVVEYILLRGWDIFNETRRMIECHFLEEFESAVPGHTGVDQGGDQGSDGGNNGR